MGQLFGASYLKAAVLLLKGEKLPYYFEFTGLESVNENVLICDVIVDIRQSFLSYQQLVLAVADGGHY